jgi:hypothetical protein
MASTVEESRTTWLLIALIALAGRLAVEKPDELADCFPDPSRTAGFEVAAEQTA